MGGTAAAREELSTATAQSTLPSREARASFLHGCEQFADSHDDKAAEEFERASKLDGSNAVYHFWLGRVYGTQAEKANVLRQPSLAKRTKDHFERAVTLDPDFIDAREGLLQFYLQAPGFVGGSKDNAKREAAEIASRSPYRGGFASANIARALKDSAGLVRAYESLTTQFPDSVAPYVLLLNEYAVRHDWRAAWQTLDRLEKAVPSYAPIPYVVGRLAAESGERLEEGAQSLRAYLTRQPSRGEPSLANAHWRLGMILEKLGDRSSARSEYQSALSLDPVHKAAKEALGKLR